MSSMLPFNTNLVDFEHIVSYLHGNNGTISREQIIKDVICLHNPTLRPLEEDSKAEQESKHKRACQILENVSRLSKTELGMQLYSDVNGTRGYIRATNVNKKSYYEALIATNVQKYNVNNSLDVQDLVKRTLPLLSTSESTKTIIETLCNEYNYVLGSIAPSVGAIKSAYSSRVTNVRDTLMSFVEVEKDTILLGNKPAFIARLLETVGDIPFALDEQEVIDIVMGKLKRIKDNPAIA